MPVKRHLFIPLKTRDPRTWEGLNDLTNYVETMARRLNLEPQPAAQSTAEQTLPPPLPAASFSVTGVDGQYRVVIGNNNANFQPVYHEVASATSMTFDAAASVTVFGPDVRTEWSLSDPGTQKFWRLRSKFLNSGFNTPMYFTAGGTSAPFAVASGVLRVSSTAQRTQHSANTITAYAEYLASGAMLANGDTSDGTPTIDWAAGSVAKDGGTTVLTVPKTTIRGLDANTAYVLAWDTSHSVAQYSTQGSDLIADSYIYLATVLTPSAAGGSASSAGGGPNATGVEINGGRYSYT
jgi:hypothetical protein